MILEGSIGVDRALSILEGDLMWGGGQKFEVYIFVGSNYVNWVRVWIGSSMAQRHLSLWASDDKHLIGQLR